MIITLLTDFGLSDTFAGVLKGVIKTHAPQAEVIDLTHQIPPQDIAAGALALSNSYAYFPAGTIHVIVVDPGVGSTRRPIAAHIGDMFYVCPDNGLLTYVLAENTLHGAVILDNPAYHLPHVSRTFHGRDLFAPVAAHLSNGVPLETLGTHTDTLQTFPLTYPHVAQDSIICEIISFDIYGNAYTNLTEDTYRQWNANTLSVRVQEHDVAGPVNAYADAALGAPLCLFGSSGRLEIAVRNGSARAQLGLQIGRPVYLSRKTVSPS